MTVLRRIIVGVVAAAALLVTPGLAAADGNSCHDHSRTQVSQAAAVTGTAAAVRPSDGCPNDH